MEPIDALVRRARAALANADQGYAEAGRQLDEKVMRPVRGLLGESRNLLVSPDGMLNLVPFAALTLTSGQPSLCQATVARLTLSHRGQ